MIRRLLGLAQLLAVISVLVRLSAGAQRHPAVSPPNLAGARAKKTTPGVTVLIPARNEEHRLRPCLEALQHEPTAEVIVIDDGSTDGTAELARSLGATVITAEPLPEGWVGKPWALQAGLEAASSESIICLDADTIPKPGLVLGAVAAAEQHGTHFLTLGCRFVCDDIVQRALHASMLTTLVYRFGPPGTKQGAKPERVLANGQCMVFRREWLENQGGFSAVANNMTDDIALARTLAGRGAQVAFLDGADLIDVRMYESVGEVWREWGRSLPMPDATKRSTSFVDLGVLWLTLALPGLRCLIGRTTALDKMLLGMRFALCAPMQRSYYRALPAVFLSPLFDIASVVRLTQATLHPVRDWRGRSYGPLETADQ